MIKILDYVLDIFFPKKCIICSKTLEAGADLCLCDNCIKDPFLKFHNPTFSYEKFFDEIYFCLPYIDNIKVSLLNLKFNNQYILSKTFGYLSARRLENEDTDNIDIVAAVPISSKRRKDRGYNQSELIAKSMCDITGLIYDDTVIQKIKELPPVSSMNKEERMKRNEQNFTEL